MLGVGLLELSAMPARTILAPDLHIPLTSDLVASIGTATTTVTRALNTGTDEDAAGLISTVNANLPRFYRGLGVLSEATATSIQPNEGGMVALAGGTLTADDTTAPDGSVNGDLFTADSATGFHYTGRGATDNNCVLGEVYTISAKYKPGTETVIQLTPGSGVFNNSYVNFICTGSGSIGNAGSNVIKSGCDLRSDGWYECWYTTLCNIASKPNMYVCYTGNNSSAAYFPSYEAAGETGHFWGNSEVGILPYLTTHIPTPSHTEVVRNADVIEVDESLPNPSAVSWGLDYTPLHDSGEIDYLWSSQSDTNNGVYVYYDGTIFRCRKRVDGDNFDAWIAVDVVRGQTYRILCMLDDGVSIAVNGVVGTTNTNTTDAVVNTTAYLGSNGTGGGQSSMVISEYKRYD